MFSISVVCTLNTHLKLLPFKRCTVLRPTGKRELEFDSNCIAWVRILSQNFNLFGGPNSLDTVAYIGETDYCTYDF